MTGASTADDADLFARAGHDVAAFEALYRGHVRRVTAYAAARCSPPSPDPMPSTPPGRLLWPARRSTA